MGATSLHVRLDLVSPTRMSLLTMFMPTMMSASPSHVHPYFVFHFPSLSFPVFFFPSHLPPPLAPGIISQKSIRSIYHLSSIIYPLSIA